MSKLRKSEAMLANLLLKKVLLVVVLHSTANSQAQLAAV